MKIFIKWLFVFLFALNADAQYQVFLKNGIVKEGNIETEQVGVFNSKIKFVTKQNNEITFSVNEIEKIIKDKMLFQNFKATNANMFFKNKEALLQQILNGKINLWSYKYIYTYNGKNAKEVVKKIATRNIFFIEDLDKKLIRLDLNTFRNILKNTLKGDKETLRVLNHRGYPYSRIPSIISDYNKRNTNH